MTEAPAKIDYQNRITGYGVKRASQFLAHPDNPHIHPMAQRRVIGALLGEIGWIGVAVENERTGYLIDGHERVWQALANDDAEVPFITVDLSEEEEARALATFDPSGDMGKYDGEALGRLFGRFTTEDGDTLKLFSQLMKKSTGSAAILNTDGLREGEDEDGGSAGAPPSAIVMRHVFMNVGNVGEFDAQVEALMDRWDVGSLTDVVREAVSRAHAGEG